MLNHVLGITEIRDFPAKIDVITVEAKARTIVLTYLKPSASLQSP